MSIGSTLSVKDSEDQYRENCAKAIAEHAAELVASHDMDRTEAIQAATEYIRQHNEASNDITGVSELGITYPNPSRNIPPKQIAAIKKELMNAARNAAETL